MSQKGLFLFSPPCGGSSSKKPFFHVFQIPEQPFLGYVVHLRGRSPKPLPGNAFLYFADKGRQYAGVERKSTLAAIWVWSAISFIFTPLFLKYSMRL